jgi:chromosome segregation ATPase
LSGLQKASSSPNKGKGKEKEKLDLSDKWREVEREVEEFSETVEHGTEREKQLNERCGEVPAPGALYLRLPEPRH